MDTNTIFECHRTGCWAMLAGALHLETVEACIIETQTGAHNQPASKRIDEAALRASFKQVNNVTPLELAKIALMEGPYLDAGELALWAHALGRPDAWVLCGPDRASMKFGVRHGKKDRLVSLGAELAAIGARPRTALKPHYEEAWLRKVITDCLLGKL